MDDAEDLNYKAFSLYNIRSLDGKNFTEALGYYLKAAELGHPHACEMVGDFYFLGHGLEEDEIKAHEFYLKADKIRAKASRCPHPVSEYYDQPIDEISIRHLDREERPFITMNEQEFIAAYGKEQWEKYWKEPELTWKRFLYQFNNESKRGTKKDLNFLADYFLTKEEKESPLFPAYPSVLPSAYLDALKEKINVLYLYKIHDVLLYLRPCYLTWTDRRWEYYTSFWYESTGPNNIRENVNELAEYWNIKAAMNGCPFSQFILGLGYLCNKKFPENRVQRTIMLRLAAEWGIPEAQFHLGRLYQHSEAVKSYHAKEELAFSWYEKAAIQGYSDAQYVVAMCYDKGVGIGPSHGNEVIYWLKKAAIQHHLPAQNNLAIFLKPYTSYLRISEIMSGAWLLKAAKQGWCIAQLNLAYISYLWQNKDEKDESETWIYWCQKAKEQGCHKAIELLEELTQKSK